MNDSILARTFPDPGFYTVGGSLKPSDLSYIPRAADQQLRDAISRNSFCYLLTPRQMGKTSLMARTVHQLRTEGVCSVVIDLTGIGARGLSAEEWYLGQVASIAVQLGLKLDYLRWWEQRRRLSEVNRFVNFLTQIVVNEVSGPVVIFVDEIDFTLDLPFSDDYFAAIRSLYNARSVNPTLERLIFVLLGVASPSDLIKDPKLTPFNIGTRIQLADFTLEEAQPLAAGLGPDLVSAQQLLANVLYWTGGHPYLTQKTCVRVAQWAKSAWNSGDVPMVVSKLVEELFFSETGRSTDDNLLFVRDRVRKSALSEDLLRFYLRIRRTEVVRDDELGSIPAQLKLSGLIKATEARELQVRNRIYERVFDESWIRQSLAETGSQRASVLELRYEILDLLSTMLPMESESGRLAFLLDAGLPSRLLSQMYAEESPSRFVALLVDQLISYGMLDDGRYAIDAVLEAARAHAGQPQRLRIDLLLPKLRDAREKQVSFPSGPSISVLFLAADPHDATRLRLGEELREIAQQLQMARFRDRFALHLRTATQPADISQALLDVQPQIVHYSGHGTPTGALSFEDREGRVRGATPEVLESLFRLFSDQVRVVILDACYSEAQARAIAHHIPYVVGMHHAISAAAAIVFSTGFYQALGAGRSVEDAYKLGCVQIRLQDIPKHLTPVLITQAKCKHALFLPVDCSRPL